MAQAALTPTAPASTPAAPAATPEAPPTVHPSDRLAEARALLLAGDMPNARAELEAAAAQLTLQSTLPGQFAASSGPTLPARQVNRALRWLDSGQPQQALALIGAALSELPSPSWTASR